MNNTYQPPTPPAISVKEAYSLDTILIPDGFEAFEFRPPNEGEMYLSLVDAFRGGKTFSYQDGIAVNGPRLILRQIRPKQKTVRVVRVLEYVGPESWIETTMKNNGVKGIQVVGSDRTIRELSIFKEEVK